MIRLLLTALYWFLLALLFSAAYASVEGAPYAEGLPVWRPDVNLWWVRFLYWVPNLGRPVNGMDTFGLLFLGWACLLLIPVWNALHGHPIPISEWLEMVAYVVAIGVVEDWVWYAINPGFGFKHFNASELPRWMYSSWFFGLPSQYWEAFVASYAILCGSVKCRYSSSEARHVFREAMKMFLVMWITFIASVFAVAAIANDRWMHQRNF